MSYEISLQSGHAPADHCRDDGFPAWVSSGGHWTIPGAQHRQGPTSAPGRPDHCVPADHCRDEGFPAWFSSVRHRTIPGAQHRQGPTSAPGRPDHCVPADHCRDEGFPARVSSVCHRTIRVGQPPRGPTSAPGFPDRRCRGFSSFPSARASRRVVSCARTLACAAPHSTVNIVPNCRAADGLGQAMWREPCPTIRARGEPRGRGQRPMLDPRLHVASPCRTAWSERPLVAQERPSDGWGLAAIRARGERRHVRRKRRSPRGNPAGSLSASRRAAAARARGGPPRPPAIRRRCATPAPRWPVASAAASRALRARGH